MRLYALNALPEHAAFVGANLRPSDVKELEAMAALQGDSRSLSEMCEESAAQSDLAIALFTPDKDDPLAVLGIVTLDVERRLGSPWLLATDDFDEVYNRTFHTQSQVWVDALCAPFEHVANFVLASNRRSVRWLRSLGFTVDPPKPDGFSVFWRSQDV